MAVGFPCFANAAATTLIVSADASMPYLESMRIIVLSLVGKNHAVAQSVPVFTTSTPISLKHTSICFPTNSGGI